MFIFDQWPKLHLGLDALSNKKILKGVLSIMSIQAKHKEFNINQRNVTERPHNRIKNYFKLSKGVTKERKLLMKSW